MFHGLPSVGPAKRGGYYLKLRIVAILQIVIEFYNEPEEMLRFFSVVHFTLHLKLEGSFNYKIGILFPIVRPLNESRGP